MWHRTKRLVNSYLDNLIDKAERPEQQVQDAGTVKASQLGKLAAETLATVKLFEKQAAQVESKIAALENRLATTTNETQRMILQSQLDTSRAELFDLQQRIAEARGTAAQVRAARDAHPNQVRETVNNAHLAKMGEVLAGSTVPTRADDPAWVMDEMRAKIERRGLLTTEGKIAAADAELVDTGKDVDNLLAQYKNEVSSQVIAPPPVTTSDRAAPQTPQPGPEKADKKDDGPVGGKTLGTAGEVKSLD